MSDPEAALILTVLIGLAAYGLAASILIFRDKAVDSRSAAKPFTFREQLSKQVEHTRKQFEQITNDFGIVEWLIIAVLILGIAFAAYFLDLPPGPHP
jgi:hypothetical protein